MRDDGRPPGRGEENHPGNYKNCAKHPAPRLPKEKPKNGTQARGLQPYFGMAEDGKRAEENGKRN